MGNYLLYLNHRADFYQYARPSPMQQGQTPTYWRFAVDGVLQEGEYDTMPDCYHQALALLPQPQSSACEECEPQSLGRDYVLPS